MEGFVVLLLLLLAVLAAGSICGMIAVAKLGRLRESSQVLQRRVDLLKTRVDSLERGRRAEAPFPLPAVKAPRAPAPLLTRAKLAPPYVAREAPPSARPAPQPPMLSPEPPKPVVPEPAPDAAAREWWAAFEEQVGKRWMTWGGAFVLFLSAGFFVKYAIDHAWITPAMRDVVGGLFGATLIALGIRFVRREMRALGQGLMGGGLAILYVSLYAAYAFHGLLSQPVAFGAMMIVSAVGMMLSVRHDALPISILAILGGFLTPIMVSTGRDQRDLLFAYVLLLDLSVLGVAFFKRWRALGALAFVGTSTLFTMWFLSYYTPAAKVPAILWLTVFYLVFLILPFVECVWRKVSATVERFVMALVNATGVSVLAWRILRPENKHALGFYVLGMSAAYLVLGVLCRKRVPEDRRGIFGFITIAMVFFTVSIMLHFGLNGITICWAAQAPALLYLGYKFSYRPVRLGGLAMIGLTIVRLFARHWPLHESGFPLFVNAAFWTAMCVAIAGGVYAAIHHWWKKESSREDTVLKVGVAIVSGFLALVIVHAEVALWFRYYAEGWTTPHEYFGRSCAVVIWALGAVGFFLAGLRWRVAHARAAAVLALAVSIAIAARLYGMELPGKYLLVLNTRFAAALAPVAVAFGCAAALTRFRTSCSEKERAGLTYVFALAGYLMLVLLTAENFRHSRGYESWCLGVFLWTLGSAVFLAAAARWLKPELKQAAVGTLAVLTVIAVRLYWKDAPDGYLLLFNLRFLACVVGAAALFGFGRLLRRRPELYTGGESAPIEQAYAPAIMLLFFLLSREAYLYCLTTVSSAADARWSSQMALTIVWSAYATGLLAVGFWKKSRPLRLAALGLFAATALKLVLVDMAHVKQFYRIVSFFVMGLLMMAASYLYHRVEKHLAAVEGAEGAPGDAGPGSAEASESG